MGLCSGRSTKQEAVILKSKDARYHLVSLWPKPSSVAQTLGNIRGQNGIERVFINWAHLAWSLLSCGGKHGGRGPPHCHLGAPWLIEVELMSFWSVTCFSSLHELLLSCRCFWIPAYLIKTNYIFIVYFYNFQFPVLITFSCQCCESLVITMK